MKLTIGVFSSSAVASFGRQRGTFAAAGFEVVEERVESSVQAFRDLDQRHFDLLITSPDNVLAYRYNLSNPLARLLPVQIILGVDRGLGLSLFGAPGIATVADLIGGDVAVDAARTGFAYAAYWLLEQAGLAASGDYSVAELGVTPRRRVALEAGECSATMLNAGHDHLAEAHGCVRLRRVSSDVGTYLGSVLVAREDTIAANAVSLRDFRTVWLATAAEMVASVNAAEVEFLLQEVLACDGEVASRYRRTLADPGEGLLLSADVDSTGLQTVINLRASNSGFDDSELRAGGSHAWDELWWRG